MLAFTEQEAAKFGAQENRLPLPGIEKSNHRQNVKLKA
jgi:hypothetical protein